MPKHIRQSDTIQPVGGHLIRKPRYAGLVDRHIAETGRELFFLNNVCSRRTLRAINHIKTHPRPFLQGFKTLCLDGGMMNKNILAAILSNKTKPFCIVKPLHRTLSHLNHSFMFCS